MGKHKWLYIHGIQQSLIQTFPSTKDEEKDFKSHILEPLQLIGLGFISQTLMSGQEVPYLMIFFLNSFKCQMNSKCWVCEGLCFPFQGKHFIKVINGFVIWLHCACNYD